MGNSVERIFLSIKLVGFLIKRTGLIVPPGGTPGEARHAVAAGASLSFSVVDNDDLDDLDCDVQVWIGHLKRLGHRGEGGRHGDMRFNAVATGR